MYCIYSGAFNLRQHPTDLAVEPRAIIPRMFAKDFWPSPILQFSKYTHPKHCYQEKGVYSI